MWGKRGVTRNKPVVCTLWTDSLSLSSRFDSGLQAQDGKRYITSLLLNKPKLLQSYLPATDEAKGNISTLPFA